MCLEFKADAQHAASTSQKSFNSPRANQSLEAMRQSVLSGAEGSLAPGRDCGLSHVAAARGVPENESKCFRFGDQLVRELDVLSPVGSPASSGSVL